MSINRKRKFISFYQPYKSIFIKDMLAAFILSIISLIIPLVARYITNTVLVSDWSNKIEIISYSGIGLLVLAIFEFMCNHYVLYQGHVMGALMERDIRKQLFEHYQKLSFTFYDNHQIGKLLSRITSDLYALTELYHHGPEDIVLSLLKLIGAFVILLTINIPLTLILFSFIPVIFFIMYYFNRRLDYAHKNHKKNTARFNAKIVDNLSGIRVVKSFSNEELEIEKMSKYNNDLVTSKSLAMKYMAGYFSTIKIITTILTIIIIIIGSLFIVKQQLTIGDLVAFLLYINNFVEPLRRLVNFNEMFQDGLTGFSRFCDILDVHIDIDDKKDAITLENVLGIVDFNNISFRYQKDLPEVFTNINLHAEAGEYLALVGSSGVGKSTLCSLLPRFYEATSGTITIDGINIKDVTLKSLRQNIGVVQQDVYLFAGSVYDNIGYGKNNATKEEIIKAAKLANAHDFIMELPDGYDSDIGENGVKLSGGQKQRLSIARVFLKNPAILIFDEATSSLDNESEAIVQQSLEKLALNRTTFVIAHRLSTIKNAKKILVLANDGVVEQGDHEQLLAKGGQYAKLYNMQFNQES